MKIIFFGSDPWFSPPVLEAILKAKHQVALIVTKGDAFNEGKRQKEKGKRKFIVVQAKNQKDVSLENICSSFFLLPSSLTRPDAVVLAAFGPPFLSKEILNWPKYGCLNVHASLLPRWRGASPVFGAIAAGDKETGVSIMKMTEEIDLGPVLGQKRTVLSRRGPSSLENRESLTRRLGILGGKLIVKTLKKLQNGQINEVKQPPKSPTPYTRRLTKDSGLINWKKSPVETERFIRAVTPWPGAWTEYREEGRRKKEEGKQIKILKAHLEIQQKQQDCHAPQSGTRNDVTLVIDEIQLPGKNPISWKQFLAGHPGAELG